MPSQEPTAQERGFRTALWGFDKNDVLAYVNALANETQQQELTYQEQVSQLEAQVEKLKKEQSNARICVEKLQSDLTQATARAETAENERLVLQSQLTAAEDKAMNSASRYQEARKLSSEAQLRVRDLEKELARLRAETAEAPAAPAAAPAPQPQEAVEQPRVIPAAAPAPTAPQPVETVTERARIEARKILADARLTAEAAEKRMKAEAEEQKNRMANNARDLAAGVLLLRDRLARVDEKLATASMDLENATAAIYEALDNTTSQITELGGEMRAFGDKKPEQPQPQPEAEPAQRTTLRPKATVNRRQKPKPAPAPQPEQARRLRRTEPAKRSVSQDLLDAISRLENT